MRGARPAAVAGCLLGLAAIAGGCAPHRPPELADRLVRGNNGGARATPKHSADLPTAETVSVALAEALAALSQGETPDRLRDGRPRVPASPRVRSSRRVRVESHCPGAERCRVVRPACPHLARLGPAGRRTRRRAQGRLHGAVVGRGAGTRSAPCTLRWASSPRPSPPSRRRWRCNRQPPGPARICVTWRCSNGDESEALARCGAALAADPSQPAARNNLALIHAAAGRLDDARREFMAAGPVAGNYNMGIVFLARREYTPRAWGV